MHQVIVDAQTFKISLLGYHCLKLAVTVDASVDINSGIGVGSIMSG